MESRQRHNLSAGIGQDSGAREKIGDREASRGGGCPHYMKNLIQIKEVNLDFGQMITSSKVKTCCCPRTSFECGGGIVRSQRRCQQNVVAGLRVTLPNRRRRLSLRPHWGWGAGGQWHGLQQANRERNAPNPALANFSSHARCHTGHTVTHIKTLEILKTRGTKQGLACSCRRPPLSSRSLYGNVWHWNHSFCCLCGSRSAYVISKSSGYIHTPVAPSGREGARSSEFCLFLSGHGCGSSGGVWEVEEENRGSASVGLGTY